MTTAMIGTGHCCACAGICHHAGPARFCDDHKPQPVGVPVTEPRPGRQDIAAIGELLHALDRCMTDEHIPGHIRRRVLNRYVWGTPDGDPDMQLAVLVDHPEATP